ncbi:MAG: hypothetical protein AAF745_04095 [Planctomycetota bacterium]
MISSSDPGEATVTPTAVTILAGSLTADVIVTGVSDGMVDGTQTTNIVAT